MTIPQMRGWRVHVALIFHFAVAALRTGAQVTETPQTIAPGKIFVRMDAVSVGLNRDTSEPTTYTALGLASTILSTGLTRELDVQAGVQLFVRQTYQFHGSRTTHSGLGDMTFRTKWMFWQDSAFGASAAVIPFVKIPSSTIGNKHLEGGVIVPWSMALGTGTEAGAMAEWDYLRNDANDGYDSRWFASGFARQHLFAGLGLYAEVTVSASSGSSSSFAGTMGGGATLDISKLLQFDYGVNRGLGGRATDWTHVLRLRWEF